MANDSGGGCLLWLITYISAIFRNRRIYKYNKQARGVEAYQSINVDALFPSRNYKIISPASLKKEAAMTYQSA